MARTKVNEGCGSTLGVPKVASFPKSCSWLSASFTCLRARITSGNLTERIISTVGLLLYLPVKESKFPSKRGILVRQAVFNTYIRAHNQHGRLQRGNPRNPYNRLTLDDEVQGIYPAVSYFRWNA